MAKTANKISALKFLTSPASFSTGALCAVVGDDAFLRHEVQLALANRWQQEAEESFGLSNHEGKTAELRDVLDALRERSLFGAEQKLVIVEDADPFVKQYRDKLEAYVDNPAEDALLVLEVKSWPGNTRLAKAVAQVGLTITCQVPQQGRELTEFTKQLKDWLIHLAQTQHECDLQRSPSTCYSNCFQPKSVFSVRKSVSWRCS